MTDIFPTSLTRSKRTAFCRDSLRELYSHFGLCDPAQRAENVMAVIDYVNDGKRTPVKFVLQILPPPLPGLPLTYWYEFDNIHSEKRDMIAQNIALLVSKGDPILLSEVIENSLEAWTSREQAIEQLKQKIRQLILSLAKAIN